MQEAIGILTTYSSYVIDVILLALLLVLWTKQRKSTAQASYLLALRALHTILQQHMSTLVQQEIAPNYLAGEGEIPADWLTESRRKFITSVVNSLSKDLRKDLRRVFTDEGLVHYVGSYFDRALLEHKLIIRSE